MKNKIVLTITIVVLSISAYSQTVKVACIGDSVTYGYGIENNEENSYPAQLQQLLGSNYNVQNFGYSGATMLKNGHKPYWDKPVFKKSQEFAPNIVVIHLGLNDQGNNNWPQHKNEFEQDYLEMISTYKNLPSKPKVIICKMTPTFSGHHWFEEGMRENFKEIQAIIAQISEKASVQLIDLHEPLYRYPEFFPDNLHPTKEGAKIIASKIYSGITGNYGGLKLPLLYGENMVIQRNEPIVFKGIANFNDQVTVEFNHVKKVVKTDLDGNWEATFESMAAGGPHKLKFYTTTKNFHFEKVFIGEVWLASGQSNMDFKLADMENASSILKDSLNPNVFLFSMDGKTLSGQKFSETELLNCNANVYFENSGWKTTTTENLQNFSAVAYSYAYNLQKELDIPVGIICNAIGGSPIQSWVSRESMEQEHYAIDLLNDTYMNPMTDSWVSNRMAENFENNLSLKLKVRHPYTPTFLFDAGIEPIKNYAFKGVIWYQGESNTEHILMHTVLFKMLVNDWRIHFKKPEMPFYFVQLSSINRPNWGKFRDSQRKLLEIPNTGMAVSSDVGHPTDVHPKEKWTVGERLSSLALAKSYGKRLPYSGPLFDYVNILNDKIKVYFKFADGLKTKDGKEVADVQIAGDDHIFVSAKTTIKKNKLIIWSPEIKNPRYVKYGYTPFTAGNLINKHGLPASTFSNIFK